MSSLMEKLALSKAIMDKHNSIGRGGIPTSYTPSHDDSNENEYETPQANYNIPQEYLSEEQVTSRKSDGAPLTKDAIMNSKLPDEIKRLMIENPIVATNPLVGGGPVLSEELVEKASKLMGTNKKQSVNEQRKPQGQNQTNTVFDNKEMRKLMKEVVQEVLKENGLILESSNKTDETMVIKVGQHIFEGKINKIKKLKS